MKSKWAACSMVAAVLGLILMAPQSSLAGNLRVEKVDYKEKGQEMWIHKERTWKAGYPQITGIVSSREDINSPTKIHVYFFDEDKKLVGEVKRVACTRSLTKSGVDVGFAAPTKMTRRTDVLFMMEVPQSLVDRKWSRAVVVFVAGNEAAAETEPHGSVEDYDFPEKDLVLKSK